MRLGFMYRSFRGRILICMAVIMAVAGIGVYCFSMIQISNLTEAYQRELLSERINLIFATIQQDYKTLSETELEHAYSKSFGEFSFSSFVSTYRTHKVCPVIFDRNGRELLRGKQDEWFGLAQKIVRINSTRFEFKDTRGDPLWVIGGYFEPLQWSIAYIVSEQDKNAQANSLSRQLASIILVVFFGSFFLIFLIVSRLTRPVSELTKASIAMADGNLDFNLPKSSTSEIALLTHSFSVMRISIRNQLSDFEREIKERRLAEKFSRQKETDLNITLNSIGDAVITTDASGLITRMNPVAEMLTGWDSKEAVGQLLSNVLTLYDEFDSETLHLNLVDIVLGKKDGESFPEYSILHARDGAQYRVSDSAAPIRDSGSVIVGIVIVFRDITKESALQDQLQHSQKMDAIGQLAGGVAHDFNNVLGGILGASDLLLQMTDEPDKRDLLQMIIKTVRRASDLTQKLLTFGRKGRIQSTPIDAHTAIAHAVAILKRSIDKRISLVVKTEAEASVVIGDVSLLQNAILNLGINAAHAMPEGGAITIETNLIELDPVYCSASPFELVPGQYLEISVSDTGEGIEPTNLNKIFEPFFTTKERGKGTGLGLSAVYGTIQQHNGAIMVYSELGRGTVFRIYLPLVDEEEGVVQQDVMELVVPGSGCILVVDDEEMIRVTAKATLVSLGYDVILADNGKTGLERYKNNHQNIDAILLDMVMPEMDGRDCFRGLQKINPDVRVVLASGFSVREDVDEMVVSGLKDVIRKPYSAAEVSQALANAMA